MEYIDINKDKEKIVLLIHPMLSSSEGMKKLIADNIGNEYRYIIPDLSAHGKLIDRKYLSVKQESENLYNYFKENDIAEVSLAFGASIGGVVLLELLKHKDIKIVKALFEGCSLCQNASILEFIIRNIFLYERKKAIKNSDSANRKIISIYGETKGRMMTENLIRIDKQSIKNICHDCAFVDLPKLSEAEQKRCIFCYGSKEVNLKYAKRAISKEYPYAALRIWKGQNHCTKITTNVEEYCKMIKAEID